MTRNQVQVGSCGFRVPRAEYFGRLPCVEVQQTFYQPPQLTTLARWRKEAPADFEFTLKAWMLITHEAKSPTYRRLKRPLSERERAEVGAFKWTPAVREAWAATAACARALRAKAVLFQCPASFTPTRANLSNLGAFFASAERDGLDFCWEPRGEWRAEVVAGVCKDYGLWHAVDPFAGRTVTPERCYFRLHGRRGWRYRYEDGELAELAATMPREERSYVFFNNIHMTEDAMRFREILGETR